MMAFPVGIGIGVAYVALSYIAGSFFTSEKIKAYAKIEIGELLLTTILLAIILSAYGSSDLLNAVAGSGSDVGGTVSKIETQLQIPLEKAVDSLMYSSYGLSKYMSYYYNIHAPTPYVSPIFSDSPGSGMGPLQMQISAGLDTVVLNLFLVKAVKTLYIFLEFVLSGLILPLGVILRFIPPTRKIGGILIGTALAVHFVFPAAVEWTTQLAPAMMPTYTKMQYIPFIPDPGNPPDAGVICSEVMQTVYTLGDLLGPLVICLVACLVATIGYLACVGYPGIYPILTGTGCLGAGGNSWGFYQYIFPVSEIPNLSLANIVLTPDKAQELFEVVIGKMMPAIIEINLTVLIMIVIQIAATIVLARAFSQALGAEGQLYGIGRLI